MCPTAVLDGLGVAVTLFLEDEVSKKTVAILTPTSIIMIQASKAMYSPLFRGFSAGNRGNDGDVVDEGGCTGTEDVGELCPGDR